MNNGQQTINPKTRLLAKKARGRSAFGLAVLLSIINIVLALINVSMNFPYSFSSVDNLGYGILYTTKSEAILEEAAKANADEIENGTITLISNDELVALGVTFTVIGAVALALVIAVFFLSKKKDICYIFMVVLVFCDTAYLVYCVIGNTGMIVNLIFHALLIYEVIDAFIATAKLKKIAESEPVVYEASHSDLRTIDSDSDNNTSQF